MSHSARVDCRRGTPFSKWFGRQGLVALCALLLVLFTGRASAACNWDLNISPPLPVSIASTQTVGAIIYSGTVTVTTTACTYTSLGPMTLRFLWGNTATTIQGMTGITVERPSYSVSSDPSCGTFSVNQDNTNSFRVRFSAVNIGTACNFVLSIGLLIKASATSISGTFPTPLSVGNTLATGTSQPGRPCGIGWVVEEFPAAPVTCTTYTSTGVNIPILTANTCTVSTPNVSVPLPNVSKTSLATVGATAGLTAFTLGLSGCSTSAGGFTGTQTWAFTPGPAANVISNTGTAANVYAQILDSSMTPITNGGTTTFSIPAGGGAQSKTFYARYYSNGTAGAGTLNSVATFTMSYN